MKRFHLHISDRHNVTWKKFLEYCKSKHLKVNEAIMNILELHLKQTDTEHIEIKIDGKEYIGFVIKR